MGPNYENLSKMLLVTCTTLLFLIIILPNAYAQENPAADIIKKSQENLRKFENKSTATVQPSSNQKPVPTVSSIAKPKTDFVNSNFATLFVNPDNYKDSTIDVTGKVANFPEVGLLQMYINGAVRHDAVVHYNASLALLKMIVLKLLAS